MKFYIPINSCTCLGIMTFLVVFCEPTLYHEKEANKIEELGNIVSTVESPSLISCAQKCKRHKDCYSGIFTIDTKQCYLLSEGKDGRNYYVAVLEKAQIVQSMKYKHTVASKIETEYRIKFGNLLDTTVDVSKTWLLSFDFILHTPTANYGSILHFTTGDNIGSHGNRIPALFTTPGKSSLWIISSINDNYNHLYASEDIGFDKKVNIKVQQRCDSLRQKYFFNVHLDGELVHEIENANPQTFQNVKIYAGDPWHEQVNGVITNFYYVNEYMTMNELK